RRLAREPPVRYDEVLVARIVLAPPPRGRPRRRWTARVRSDLRRTGGSDRTRPRPGCRPRSVDGRRAVAPGGHCERPPCPASPLRRARAPGEGPRLEGRAPRRRRPITRVRDRGTGPGLARAVRGGSRG